MAPKAVTGVFHMRTQPNAKLAALFLATREFLVLRLPVDKSHDVGEFFVVIRQVTYQQEGLQHKGLSGCQNKAAILHKVGAQIENTCFRFISRLEAVIVAEGYFFRIMICSS